MITLPSALDAMKARQRWVLWRHYTNDEGKRRKLPLDLNQFPGLSNEKRKQRNRPDVRLGTFAEALALWGLAPGAFAGVGYVPALDDPFTGLDFDQLDHASTSALNLWNGCRTTTYCEFSPSGKGGRAIVSVNAEMKQRLQGIRNIIPGLELYSDSGYFTVTGHVIANLPIADYSNRLPILADRLGLQPKAGDDIPPVSTLLTGRTIPPIEINRIHEKIGKWKNAQPYLWMRDDYAAAARWAQGSGHHGVTGPDRTWLMRRYVGYLVKAGARDADVLWAIIKDSVVWKDGYSHRQNALADLWSRVVAPALSTILETPKGDGQPVTPSFMKIPPAG
ncbi:hypothetical protein [Mesorhizobium sp. CN2-181]|uniref:hypothetical protein n=1 Tax=Mesorhizobium yinganensis TaxID=3157707 RepID=UPI0032B81863